MPRALKKDKFSLTKTKTKGERRLILNYSYEGDMNLNLKEILDFLKEKDIDPSKVTLKGSLFAIINK